MKQIIYKGQIRGESLCFKIDKSAAGRVLLHLQQLCQLGNPTIGKAVSIWFCTDIINIEHQFVRLLVVDF